ncbi:MAG: nicotinate-nucleotide--dimethylbenzimidazole phosphoribosyltransferase [Paludibacterium sp.]|uniref:nicotinate-nucleotide--dimethylbenzimidazole phosphoribosyltransferase n=1 Tax=Paludibacterium sp. TaxID=1917523 RepID=UPI0025D8209B|nr:nicotinate-nucleotide--dimethylbenzimidazole phosphoribosyltransferase [Paludibacterium sp.]MBV8046999.1 nicotinate-nucleotide--dimethylbenzimidazole phosphoribosyltransferase [Paludibacterium sp.]
MLIEQITPIHNPALAAQLKHAIDHKTKPLGSLGRLEGLALQIGLIQQTATPTVERPAMVIYAADHGVAEERISLYPPCVTRQMVENFLAGGAASSVLARQNGFEVVIVDGGVAHDFGARADLVDCKVRHGSRNFVHEPAMTHAECALAMTRAKAVVDGLAGNVVAFGEKGIGNTTPSAALMHLMTGIPLAECVGAGTGLNREGIAHKQRVIERALARHGYPQDPLAVMATYGGIEIAMMAAGMLAAAARRKVVLVDGFIATSALLVALKLQPALIDYCVFSHCSDEHGHTQMLQYLGVSPLLHLNLRLGEATGCALALPYLQAAVNFLSEMATFEAAAVSEALA